MIAPPAGSNNRGPALDGPNAARWPSVRGSPALETAAAVVASRWAARRLGGKALGGDVNTGQLC